MAATERRVCSSRRGMTVLGKVPVVPKPINLPSQRLENRGLFSDVDIVPRGICSWGSSTRFPGASGSKSRKSDAASLTPSKNGGGCDHGGRVESIPISSMSTGNSGDVGGLLGNSIQFSSAKATTGQPLDKNGKIEEPRTSNSYSRNSLESRKQETTAPAHPKSGDGYMQGVSGPPGFIHSSPQSSQSRADVSQSNGAGAGVCPNVTQQEFTGAPHHNGKKEREIIVIHMVGSPAFYGNYPPQLGYPDFYNKNGSYENFPLQFGNFEPYFGFQGHGRLDGGAQISSVSGSDLYNGREDFVCYEKECYQGRKKSGLVHGNLQESSFLGGAQRVHEALASRSSLRPRCPSQKHLSRNAGRLRSLYHDGRIVPIEDASAVPVPDKRITLLTKLSQPKLLSQDETGVMEFAHVEYVVGSALLACGDEGKAPEPFEVDSAAEGDHGEKKATSAGLKVTNEDRLFKGPELECKEVSVLTTTCNETCLHCKAEVAPLEGPASKVCQACKKMSVFESASKEVSSEAICRSNSTDGCAVEVKHVIFDADSSSLNTVKGQEYATLSSSTEAADDRKQIDNTIRKKKSLPRISAEGKVKQRLLGKKGVIGGNWKPKLPVGGAKVDIKVFAPKTRKAAGRKNTSKKTPINECVSEASSSTTCNELPMGSISGDSIKLSSETETFNKLLEGLLPSSLASSGNVPVDASQDSAEEKPKDAAFVDCIASEGCVKKRKGKTRKTTLPKDHHDIMATVHDAKSLVKTIFEDISNTEVQKQEPKDADNTEEKTWRPKGPTASQCQSATKASGFRVSKADVVPKKIEVQGRKLQMVYDSTCSADSSEVAKEEQNVAQKSNSLSNSQCCNSEALQPNKSPSFEAKSTNNARGRQSLVFRKRSADQASLGNQLSRDVKGHIGSHATSVHGEHGPEHTKQSFDFTLSCESSLADMNCSVSASKYHMIRRRVYHVVEGSGGDYSIPSATLSGKSHLAGKYRSLQTTSLQNQAEFQKKAANLSLGSSYSESEHSEEFVDSMCMVETTSCRFQSKGMCHSGLAANQILSSSGIEKSKAKKHVRPGEHGSAWKPKATPLSGVLQNFIQKKDDNKSGASIFTYTEGESEEVKDSDNSSQVSASSHMCGGTSCEEQTIKNVCELPLESVSVRYESLKEIDHAVNAEDKSEEVVSSQQKSEIVVSKEVEHTPALNYDEEVLKAEILGSASSCEKIVPQQSMQTCSEENAAANCRPPFKKKNAISHEKADRYHQMMFKKYKETGHWKPKAGLNSRASNRASRNVSEAPMQDVLVLA